MSTIETGPSREGADRFPRLADPGLQANAAEGQTACIHEPSIRGKTDRVNGPGQEMRLVPMGRRQSLVEVDAGERFRAIRTALGISTEEAARRSRSNLGRRSVEKIESGELKLGSVKQRAGMSAAYGLTMSEVDALISGELSIDAAIAIARSKTAEIRSQTSSRGVESPAQTTNELGNKMGTAIALRAADLARFPNLEFCIEYWRRNEKCWDPPVIAAARAGWFGEDDLPTTGAWVKELDRLQAIMRHASIDKRERPREDGKR